MSHVNEDDPDDKPLDPEMEKVRRKMVRLLAVSIGIMFIGRVGPLTLGFFLASRVRARVKYPPGNIYLG